MDWRKASDKQKFTTPNTFGLNSFRDGDILQRPIVSDRFRGQSIQFNELTRIGVLPDGGHILFRLEINTAFQEPPTISLDHPFTKAGISSRDLNVARFPLTGRRLGC